MGYVYDWCRLHTSLKCSIIHLKPHFYVVLLLWYPPGLFLLKVAETVRFGCYMRAM